MSLQEECMLTNGLKKAAKWILKEFLAPALIAGSVITFVGLATNRANANIPCHTVPQYAEEPFGSINCTWGTVHGTCPQYIKIPYTTAGHCNNGTKTCYAQNTNPIFSSEASVTCGASLDQCNYINWTETTLYWDECGLL